MQYIQGYNRHQTYFGTLEDQVDADNTVRLSASFRVFTKRSLKSRLQ